MPRTSAHIAKLRAHAADTLYFLSNSLKPQRERAVCRAFLRTIGLRFAEPEIVAPCEEPTDVCFRHARFQVRDLLMGRRRGDEWKQRQTKWNKAHRDSETAEPVTWPKPMRRFELVDAVTEALESKSKKYGQSGCAKTDALIYADITGTRFLIRRGTRAVHPSRTRRRRGPKSGATASRKTGESSGVPRRGRTNDRHRCS